MLLLKITRKFFFFFFLNQIKKSNYNRIKRIHAHTPQYNMEERGRSTCEGLGWGACLYAGDMNSQPAQKG